MVSLWYLNVPKDILRLFDYPEDRITVIAEAAEPIYHPIPKEKAKSAP